MYPKAISQRLGFANVKVLNLSRPGLEVNNDLDIRIAVSVGVAYRSGLTRLKLWVRVSGRHYE
jgi:hypothetical protein